MEKHHKLIEIGQLNNMQQKAVEFFGAPLAIIAGAGSGKTRVITYKIAYLIQFKHIHPKRILAITFTNRAAKEMNERVIHMIGSEGVGTMIMTYHALCARILREEIVHLKFRRNFVILDPSDQRQILSVIYKNLGVQSRSFSYNSVLEAISHFKSSEITPDIAKANARKDNEQLVAQIYEQYVARCKEINALDFDDLIIFVHEIFMKFPDIAKKWGERFDHVLVDEFQDTSLMQYQIIKALVTDSNLTIVGDPDQTIYTWRHADASLIVDFVHHYPHAEIVKLEQNYRSSQTILDMANRLIKHNSQRIDKNLFSTNQTKSIVQFYHGFSDDDEGRWIADQIFNLRRTIDQKETIAILYRANYISAPIEKALITRNLPYTIWGGVRFYQREEIKDVISYLKIIHNDDELSLHRMLNVPSRKLGEIALDKIFAHQAKAGLSLWDVLTNDLSILDLSSLQKEAIFAFTNLITQTRQAIHQGQPFYEAMREFLDKVGYMKLFRENFDQGRIENISELLKTIKEWVEQNPNGQIEKYLEEIALYLDKDDTPHRNSILLMTVHTSKGLEFDHVFIAGFSESVFPSSRSLEENKPGDLEEERRLAYVAVTRAKRNLFISDSRGFSVDFKATKRPSRFLREMGVNVKDFVKEYIPPIDKNENYVTEERNFIVGDMVEHTKFGQGVIVALQGNMVDIAFKNPYGLKTVIKNHVALKKVGQ